MTEDGSAQSGPFNLLKESYGESLEYFGGIQRFNKATRLNVIAKIFERTPMYAVGESEYHKVQYSLYKALRGQGQRPIYIICEGTESIGLGEQELYLKPMDMEEGLPRFLSQYGLPSYFEEKAFVAMCKDHGIPLKKEKGERKAVQELCEELGAVHSRQKIFYEITTPVPMEEIRKAENLSDIITRCLSDGLSKDDDILYLMRGQIPIVNPSGISESEYMPFAPHMVLVTGTKAGKTTTAGKFGDVVTRPTPSRMIGFSDAKNTVEGLLHGSVRPFAVDEVSDEPQDETVSYELLNYMEHGRAERARGRGVITEGFGALLFMSNPDANRQYDPWDYLTIAEDLIEKITKRYEGFGSRIGQFYFNPDTKKVSGQPYYWEVSQKLKQIVETVQVAFRDEFTSLFRDKDILKWLYDSSTNESEDATSYEDNMTEFAKSMDTAVSSGILRGLKGNVKHLKGLALRQAFLDVVDDIKETGVVNPSTIIRHAEKHVERLQNLQLASLNYISEIAGNEYYFGRLQASKLRTISPAYYRWFIKAALLWRRENPSEGPELLEALNPYFLQIYDRKGTYNNFEKVLEHIRRSVDSANNALRGFGLEVKKRGYEYCFAVQDRKLFERTCNSVEVFDVVEECRAEGGKTEEKDTKVAIGGEYQKPQQPQHIVPLKEIVDQIREWTGPDSPMTGKDVLNSIRAINYEDPEGLMDKLENEGKVMRNNEDGWDWVK